LCNRVAILHRGRVLVCGSPMELISSLKKSGVAEVKLLDSTPKIVQMLEELEEEVKDRA